MKAITTIFLFSLLTISSSVSAQLSGAYIIGGSSANYPNLQTAIDSLVSKGMSGSVTLNLSNGFVDTTAVRIDKFISGLNSTNTLVIQTAQGSPTRATILFNNKSNKLDYAFYTNRKNVFIKNLNIEINPLSFRYTSALYMEDGDLQNCTLKGYSLRNSTSAVIKLGKKGVVENCRISGGSIGMEFYSSSNDMVISNNTISDYSEYGIRMVNGSRMNITENIISSTSSIRSGIYAFVNNSILSHNRITSPGDGMLIMGEYNKVFNNIIIAGNYGMKLFRLDSSYVENNSILVTKKRGNGVWVEPNNFSYGLYFRNNCIMHGDSGNLIYMKGSFQSNISGWDNNNWYTAGNQFAEVKNGATSSFYKSFSDWKTFSKLDASSLSVDPEYYSSNNLHAQSIAMNNSGIIVSYIKNDYDKDIRSTSSPDIGADEYLVANDNVLLSEIEIVGACSGSGQLLGTVRNSGLNNITSFNIEWSVENESSTAVNQTRYTFSGTLLPGQDTTIIIGNYLLPKGDSTSIVAYTHSPNGSADSRTLGDTNRLEYIQRQMSGTFTIGGSSPDFATIKEALNELKDRNGICDEVTFNLRSGTYSDALYLYSLYGGSGFSTNARLIFQSDPSNTSMPIINTGRGSEQLNVTSKHLTIKGLIFEITTTKMSKNMAELNGLDIIIDSCKFLGVPHTKQVDKGGIINAKVESLKILNSEMKYGKWGISIDGNNSLVENNKIENTFSGGIYTASNSNVIKNNIISFDARSNSQTGIFVSTSENALIEGNRIFIPKWPGTSPYQYGIRTISYGTDSTINVIRNNNIVSHNSGIFLNESSYISVYNNSIRSEFPAFLILVTAIADGHYKIVNNLFVSNFGTVISIPASQNPKFILEMDYNNFYSENKKTAAFQYITSTVEGYETLKEWTALTGYDANSLQVDPVLLQAKELIPDNKAMDNLGKVIMGLNKDINGINKSTSTPDIGAYEFTGSKDYTSVKPEELGKVNQLLVYPNPNNGVFNIDLKKFESEFKIVILDASGSIKWTEKYRSNTEFRNLDISYLPKGIYFLSAESADYKAITKIIVN